MTRQAVHDDDEIALSDHGTVALAYAAGGYPVFPLWGIEVGACACGNGRCSEGKHPHGRLAPRGFLDATTDVATITAWWSACPDANIGLATGRVSGFDVLDVDPDKGGAESWAELRDRFAVGRLTTPMQRTGRQDGMHYVFAHADGVRSRAGQFSDLPGLDVRGDGGYIVAPPSLHLSGRRYTWVKSLLDTPLAPWPPGLLALVNGTNGARYVDATELSPPDGPRIRDGQRNATLTSLAGTMRRRGMSEAAMLAALHADNAARCVPPLAASEVEQIARSVAGYAPAPSTVAIPILVNLGDVEPEDVDWVWDNRLAVGKLHLLIGNPGVSKSTVLLDIASRLSLRRPWPDGPLARRGSTVLLTAEDGLADTVRPRVEALGGDASSVTILKAMQQRGEERPFSLLTDLDALRGTIEATRALLVGIDPLNSYLGGDIDSYKDTAIRSALMPLVTLADETHTVVVALMHLTKDSQRQALYRALGSIGYVGAARVVLVVAEDPESEAGFERFFFGVIKTNIGPKPPALAFTRSGLAIRWDSRYRGTAVDFDHVLSVGLSRESGEEVERAKSFLRRHLVNGPAASRRIKEGAEAEGIALRTLARARAALKVEAFKAELHGPWMVRLPRPRRQPVHDEDAT